MLIITQSGLHADSNNVSAAFNTTNPTEIYKKTFWLIKSFFDKLALESSLKLSWHLAHNTINLLGDYIFASVAEFYHKVVTNRAHILYALVHIVDYDVAMQNKVLQK